MSSHLSFRLGITSLIVRNNSKSICKSCASQYQRRYTSQAAAIASEPSETTVVETSATSPTIAHRLCASIVLSRPPQITRDLHPFEKAFYLYQRRLNERTVLPFTRFFYFREETPQIIDFRKQMKERTVPARDIGKYNAYSKEGWNDELLLGAQESEPENQMEALLKDEDTEDILPSQENRVDEAAPTIDLKPVSRITEADQMNDTKSLNRSLSKTLYLLVQNSDDKWSFPTAPLGEGENLRAGVSRVLEETAGVDMNTWIVGNHPVGHVKTKFNEADIKLNDKGHSVTGDMTFFMKGRIMAGQANLSSNTLGLKDYKWVSKEEIKTLVISGYWSAVKDMLSER